MMGFMFSKPPFKLDFLIPANIYQVLGAIPKTDGGCYKPREVVSNVNEWMNVSKVYKCKTFISHTVVHRIWDLSVYEKGAQRITQSGATSEPSVTWILVGGESSHANQVSESYKVYKIIKSDVLGYFRNFGALSPAQNAMLEDHLLQYCVESNLVPEKALLISFRHNSSSIFLY